MAYPASFDNLPTNHVDADTNAGMHPALHNNANAAINAIEAILGLDPDGPNFTTVAARLAKPDVAEFQRSGVLAITTGSGKFLFPFACTIVDVRAIVGTASSGASILVDVNKNGSTIFSTQANRPSIAAAATVSGVKTPDVTAVSAGDYLTVDIDQVGSGTPGSDLTVVVTYTR